MIQPQATSSKKSSVHPRVGENLEGSQDSWEFALDIMGTEASVAELEGHLANAPDPQSATALFLQNYLASHAAKSR